MIRTEAVTDIPPRFYLVDVGLSYECALYGRCDGRVQPLRSIVTEIYLRRAGSCHAISRLETPRSIVTEIYLWRAGSCRAILRLETPGQGSIREKLRKSSARTASGGPPGRSSSASSRSVTT
eukprot:SAG25_NODE_161_length_13366_cov_13.111973_12_plen_122_part_00